MRRKIHQKESNQSRDTRCRSNQGSRHRSSSGVCGHQAAEHIDCLQCALSTWVGVRGSIAMLWTIPKPFPKSAETPQFRIHNNRQINRAHNISLISSNASVLIPFGAPLPVCAPMGNPKRHACKQAKCMQLVACMPQTCLSGPKCANPLLSTPCPFHMSLS